MSRARLAVRATLLLLAAGVTSGACARPVQVAPRAGGVDVASGQLGWATKRLATKEPPGTLVAEDGTICRVSAERYAATPPRSLVRCDWQPGAIVK